DDITVLWKRSFLSEVLLDAQWTADPVVLTYDYNFDYGDQRFPLGNTKGAYGRTLTDLRSFYVSPIKTITLSHDQRIIGEGEVIGTMPRPERIGYVFRNWSWTEGADGNGKNLPVTEEDEYPYRTPKTLHARWEPADVKITLDYNGARANVETTRKFLATYLSLPNPRVEGYDFDGWHYDTEDGPLVHPTATVTNPYPHTLVAKWKPKKVMVVYMTFGGDPIPPTEVDFGGTLGTAATVQTRKTGWVFDGWYDKPGDRGVKVTRDYPVDTMNTIVLYARYHGHKYDVTLDYCTEYKRTAVNFEKNGNDTYQVEYGAKYPQLPVPTRDGYVFIGWATQKGADGNGRADGIVGGADLGSFVQIGDRPILDVTEARNHTLYATWEAIKVKIIFDDNMNYRSPMDHEQY
ncbi:MAG: InlB B-repeat-containing protein, partial [Lachnospiraceae bacterium]|nr:InlB B-repeat-containing protein [Lachnospiraceae bacterium]